MNLKTILKNIINKENIKETCIEISKYINAYYNKSYEYRDDVIGDLPVLKLQEDEWLDIMMKDWILNWLNHSSTLSFLMDDLSHFDKFYIMQILYSLEHDKKIELKDDSVMLSAIENKRRKLIDKIQNLTEEELDNLL